MNLRKALYRTVNSELENVEDVNRLLKYINNSTNFAEFDAEAFEAHVDHIVVYNRNEIGFALKCGLILKERL